MKKKYLAILTAIALLSGILPVDVSMAAKKVTLSNKKLSVTVGKTKTLKLKNNKKSVKWTVTSGKKNVTLKSKKKTSVKIVGKKKGTAKVQAKIGKKKYVCTVTVKAKTSTKKATTAPTNTPASNAGKTTPSPTPGNTVAPTATAVTTATAETTPTVTATPTPIQVLPEEPGLYDKDMKLLYSWDELIEKGWINVSENKITGSNSDELQGQLVISTNVESIGYEAFTNCNGITNIEIPSSVTNIGDWAFQNCSSLTSIEIPSSVTCIANAAFSDCSSLSSIEIPSSVTSIANTAFSDCSSLTNIIVDSKNAVYDSRNACNAIIKTETNELVLGCKSTVIPTSVTSIGNCAFSGCSSLNNIEIPSNVTSIGWRAFRDCSNLTSIEIPSSVTSIGEWAFYGCSSLTSIYCHADSKPDGWAAYWNFNCNATVVWSYTGA